MFDRDGERRDYKRREDRFDRDGERRDYKRREDMFDRDGERRDYKRREKRNGHEEGKPEKKRKAAPAPAPRLNPDGTPMLNRKQRRALKFGNPMPEKE